LGGTYSGSTYSGGTYSVGTGGGAAPAVAQMPDRDGIFEEMRPMTAEVFVDTNVTP